MQRGAVELHYVPTNKQIADVLTKPLARVKFEYFRENLGVLQIEVSLQREVMSSRAFLTCMLDVFLAWSNVSA